MFDPNNTMNDVTPRAVAGAALTRMSRAMHLCERTFAARLPEGITVAQYSVLRVISEAKCTVTITNLANLMTVSQPTMSSTVRKLEVKGLVDIRPTPKDGRAKHVVLTEAGRNTRRACDQSVTPVVDIISAAISPEQWDSVIPFLDKLNEALDSSVPQE